MKNQDLAADLKRLKLPGMADNLDRRSREAEEAKLGYLEFAALLVQDEVASRDCKRQNNRVLNRERLQATFVDGGCADEATRR